MESRRETDRGPPQNAWAAARSGQKPAVHAAIDPHNAKFAARYILFMTVLVSGVLVFCFVLLALLRATEDVSRAVVAPIAPAVPVEYRYSR